ncbi:hypothetical protein BGX38DRAFT_1228140 [Terfezia claveryi]|nr:hypothetical protein BGX38DRAFT_1228140 [Terfezia claveryi]
MPVCRKSRLLRLFKGQRTFKPSHEAEIYTQKYLSKPSLYLLTYPQCLLSTVRVLLFPLPPFLQNSGRCSHKNQTENLTGNFFQPTFLGYLSVITLLGVLVHGNHTFQADLQEVREVMPKLADFLEESLVKRMNNLEGRIKSLEKSICRCGLGLKKVDENGRDGEGKTEDENENNGADKNDKRECNPEETTIGEETIQYANIEL